MPTLSQLTGETRTIFKVLGIVLGAFFLFFIAITVKNIIFPPPAPPPTVTFGKIPINLPISSKVYDYKIDTVTNSLPKVVSQEKVYKIEDEKSDLLALNRATDKVRQVGFTDKGIKISENVYQWVDASTGRTLTMNIMNNNFNLISNFTQSTNVSPFLGNANTAIAAGKDFLTRMGLYKNDFDDSKTQVALFSINNFALTPATSISNTQIIRVSFFQKDINGIPVFYPQTVTSPITLLVGTIRGENQVVEANFFYQKPSDQSSTYPLKTTQQAFDELKKGNAYIASYAGQSQTVSIKKVYLGYFLSEKRQDFLTPILVFEGNDSFQAFVSAVTDEWVNK